jgi:transposase
METVFQQLSSSRFGRLSLSTKTKCTLRGLPAGIGKCFVLTAKVSISKIWNCFANMLKRYQDGILNYCDYPIHTGKLEGVNNKIKVIKRKAYGFHDLRYFTLKIYQAFAN